VAAIAAPAAQAVVLDEGNTVRSENDQNGVVIKGDDKTFAAVPDGGIMVRGDDKTFAAVPDGGIMVRGDDKVIEPLPNGFLVRGERYVSEPTSGPGWNQHGYAVATRADLIDGGVLVRGERYVSEPTSGPGWNQHGYAVAKRADLIDGGALVRGERYVSQPTSGPGWNQHGYAVAKPTDIGQLPGRQVQVTSEPSGFDLRDGLFVAMAALGLALLAFGALLLSRHGSRPETA
jgi:hypothetical protein